jgi:hypothetical protein
MSVDVAPAGGEEPSGIAGVWGLELIIAMFNGRQVQHLCGMFSCLFRDGQLKSKVWRP